MNESDCAFYLAQGTYNAIMDPRIQQLTIDLASSLTRNGYQICTAESCTGGLIAKTFTDLAGSSDWFERGFVTYSNQAKVDMLGVNVATLEKYGAVSEPTVREMVSGAIEHSHAQVAVAVTGVAGPGGGNVEKPVGSVWFGFATPKSLISKIQVFNGNRQQVREQSVLFVLQALLEMPELK